MIMASLILLVTTFLQFITSHGDKVDRLFGDLYKGEIFSGYLNTADPNRKLHYIFVKSENIPEKDPVVLWLNGGPGCSSLLGFIQEHGPVIIPDFTEDFEVNKYSWNKFANMLYLESPAGVGFSFTLNGNADLHSDDTKSGIDNEKAVLDFFEKYPQYRNNDFYIAGESYAGVYVPVLAELILKNDKNINLKGILVGNGLTDVTTDVENALVDFAFDHSLYSVETRNKFNFYCRDNPQINDFNPKNVTKECNAVRKEIKAALEGLNIYDIYRICPPMKSKYGEDENSSYQRATLNMLKKINNKNSVYYNDELEPQEGIWPEGCGDDPYPTEWFNLNETKDALHVDRNITWTQCNVQVGQNYTLGNASLSIYQNTLINSGIRIWFFAGDTDAAVPFNGALGWIPKLGLQIKEKYKSWKVNNQTAGFVEEFEKNFTYITVKGAGHMAPQWKREELFVVFNSFIKGEKLPN